MESFVVYQEYFPQFISFIFMHIMNTNALNTIQKYRKIVIQKSGFSCHQSDIFEKKNI